jgi:hypothetical protein
MIKKYLITFLLLLSIQPGAELSAYIWTVPIGDSGRQEIDFELDPYYSNIGYVLSLTNDPIPRIEVANEGEVYWTMFRNIYKPRFMLVEASVNPLPLAGVYIKEEHENFYNDADVNSRINAIRSITDGFPDPGAVSLFFGNIADFIKEGDGKLSGKGYSGLLFSFGNYHIVNNTMVPDYWQEAEIKLKGSDERKKHKLEWSYALGGRFHGNPDINNTFYFFIKRMRIDYIGGGSFSLYNFFIKNSTQQVRMDFSDINPENRNISRIFILAGKNFSFTESRSVVFGLNIGALRTYRSGYSGELTETVDNRWGLLVRPNVFFNF